ncbi:hypothetical protein ACIOEW_37890 [Streptomyces sp. NPDC087901]|uniref:hypothetical protein n=1 Tax=Streptomyces sp. NPDC087901 TaxID=3365818 RepID=UPI00382279EF
MRDAAVSRPRGRRTQEPDQPPAPLKAENAALRKDHRAECVGQVDLGGAVLGPGEEILEAGGGYGRGGVARCVLFDERIGAVGEELVRPPTVFVERVPRAS